MLNVYIADLTGLDDTYDEKLNMLHKSRADKISAYKMPADRIRGLGAGLLLEKGLEDYLQTKNKENQTKGIEGYDSSASVSGMPKDGLGRPIIEYSYGPQGKPYLKDYPQIHFSLSHSGELAVLAVADSEVGIDVQEFRGYNDKIARRFYHEEEIKMLEVVSEPEKKEILFYKIWTGKEAYIKYTGQGMKQDLREFYQNEASGTICIDAEEVAQYREIATGKTGYQCSLVFHKDTKKIDKIIKLLL